MTPTTNTTPPDDVDVSVRVAKGAKWLDKHFPTDWPTLIDLEKLNLDNPRHCVLSQLCPGAEGNWNHILTAAEISEKKAHKLGFTNYDVYMGREANPEEWIDLTRAWIDLITERTEAITTPSPAAPDPVAVAMFRAGNYHPLYLAPHEIKNTDKLAVYTLLINNHEINASWKTICDILINLDPTNMKVTLS